MPSLIFNDSNGNSKEIPLDQIKSLEDLVKAHKEFRGIKDTKPKKRRLGYTLPNGKTHTFLSTKNHKYAVCCTQKDTGLACDYTDDYEKAKSNADRLNFKMNNAEWGYRKWVVIDIKEVK